MEKELKKLLNIYVNVIHGKAFPINPTTHQLHLLLDYIANLEQQLCYFKKENQELKLELSGYRQAILEDKDMLGLKEENQSLKKQLEEADLELQLLDMITDENIKYKNQQKEFIKYMNKTIEELECDDVDDEEMKGYLIQRIDTFKEILSKYKSIIGGKE